MAFTGVPVVKKIGDKLYRVTGVSLAAAAAGTIGVPGQVAEATLEGALWGQYAGEYEAVIDLQESIQVLINPAGDAVGAGAKPLRVVKTAAGLITITNDATDATSSLEIYVRYH
jgi:hypothetical protein